MNAPAARPAGWAELYRSGQFPAMLILTFGVWLHAADELMVSTVTPAIVADIGGEAYVAWLTALYEVGCIVAGAAAALAALTFGLSRSLAFAAALYGAGCIVSGVAPSMETMLAGRLLQGLGGGAMIGLAFVAIQRVLPDRLVTRGYALLSVAWGFSAFAGPMIGAAFEEAADWRWAFFFYGAQSFVFAAIAMTRLGGVIERGDVRPRMPWRVILLAFGVVAIAQAGVSASAAASLASGLLGLLLIGLFVLRDGATTPADRMLPLAAYDPRGPAGAVILLVLFLSASTMGFITYGPLLMSQLHGLRPLETGGVLLLESVAWSIMAISFAGIRDRWQSAAIAGGFTIAFLGVALQSVAMPAGPVALIIVAAIMMGGGFGAAFAFMTRRATWLVEPGERERIASAIPTMQRLGYALGAAMSGVIANASGFSVNAPIETAEFTAFAIFALSLVPGVLGLAAMLRFLSFRPTPEGISGAG
jgi:MFS family permease